MWQLRNYLLVIVLVAIVSCRQSSDSGENLNLIPDKTNPSPDYWCTWGAQNYASDTLSVYHTLSLGGHSVTAGYVNEKNLFSQAGWSTALPDELKEDLFMVLDVGWDVPVGTQFDDERWRLGSLRVVEDKFPSCKGTKAERLITLNKMVLENGWKGTGLWLPSHPYRDRMNGKVMSDKEVEDYYREALELCRAAGINYWKIDYGYRGDIQFREDVTRLARELFPGLLIEHGRGSGPLNDEECPWDTKNYFRTGSFRAWDDGKVMERFVEIAKISAVLRTYDITQQLSIPTTLDRVAQVLSELSETGEEVIINCEDEPYIGAVLGCAIGIMRHPHMIEVEGLDYDPFDFKYRVDELVRAVKWHRIAPAFGAGLSQNILDSVVLFDSWSFNEGDGWANWMNGKNAIQGAPAKVSRGMPLPIVTCDEDPPFVLCSTHPNGAVAVGTLPRVSGRNVHYPLADVTIEIHDEKKPVGIFGRFRSLTLLFVNVESFNELKLFAQDLAGDRAEDITHLVRMDKQSIVIPGDIIQAVGRKAATEGDLSEPGLIIKFH